MTNPTAKRYRVEYPHSEITPAFYTAAGRAQLLTSRDLELHYTKEMAIAETENPRAMAIFKFMIGDRSNARLRDSVITFAANTSPEQQQQWVDKASQMMRHIHQPHTVAINPDDATTATFSFKHRGGRELFILLTEEGYFDRMAHGENLPAVNMQTIMADYSNQQRFGEFRPYRPIATNKP